MRQWYCYVGEQQYGPVDDDGLRQWASEGRVGPRDSVWTDGMSDWAPASAVAGLFVGALPAHDAGAQAGTGYLRDHRGGAILALGILGIVPCFICGIVAWAMASGDLKEMRAGRMDRSGEGLTRAGMICGIIGVVLTSAIVLLYLGLFLLMLATLPL